VSWVFRSPVAWIVLALVVALCGYVAWEQSISLNLFASRNVAIQK
jgi:hypothetical protein